MRIPRIYTPQLLESGKLIELEPEPSRHLAKVLRLQKGDSLILFNGRGGEYEAKITAIDKKHLQVQAGPASTRESESRLHIHLGIAVSRGDRMDWVVQKATELGVAVVSPLETQRSGVKLNTERAAKKLRHWQQIAISACEQCGRNRIPTINPVQHISHWLEHTEAERKFVLHHRARAGALDGTAPQSLALLVGPEGGLDDAEISLAQTCDHTALQLGPRVLRTETAPLAAVAILQGLWGDMTPG